MGVNSEKPGFLQSIGDKLYDPDREAMADARRAEQQAVRVKRDDQAAKLRAEGRYATMQVVEHTGRAAVAAEVGEPAIGFEDVTTAAEMNNFEDAAAYQNRLTAE